MVSILNNYNEIFNIIEHKTSLLEDNLLIIKDENQKIVLENIKINQKVNKLELNILKQDEEIKELKEDNLKKDGEIKELKTEIKEFKIEIKELKEYNKKKDEKIDKLEFKILKNKIFEALSDIINNKNLEEKISEIYDDLNYLICHSRPMVHQSDARMLTQLKK